MKGICKHCKKEVLQMTLDRNGGHCMICVKGPFNCASCEVPLDRMPYPNDKVHFCSKCEYSNTVSYEGMTVTRDWVINIYESQEIQEIKFGKSSLKRIKFGNEKTQIKFKTCPDCAVRKGMVHVPSCDTEECPNCHGQLIACSCKKKM